MWTAASAAIITGTANIVGARWSTNSPIRSVAVRKANPSVPRAIAWKSVAPGSSASGARVLIRQTAATNNSEGRKKTIRGWRPPGDAATSVAQSAKRPTASVPPPPRTGPSAETTHQIKPPSAAASSKSTASREAVGALKSPDSPASMKLNGTRISVVTSIIRPARSAPQRARPRPIAANIAV